MATPQVLRSKLVLSGTDLAARLPRLVEVLGSAKLPSPVSFETPIGAAARPIERLVPAQLKRGQVRINLADGADVAFAESPAAAQTLVELGLSGDALSETQVVAALEGQVGFCRALLAQGAVVSGTVERFDTGVDALPEVPLARRLAALIVTEQQVREAYVDPKPFWSAWSSREQYGELTLLSRHLQLGSSEAWFRACFHDQWAMARAAKPGDTFYGARYVLPGCEDLLATTETRLTQVGYHDGHVELAGYVPSGAHVPPWEILHWGDVRVAKQLPDGSPVSHIRVVFRNEAMARSEGTPLLDQGLEVVYLGRDGLYHSIV